MDVVSYCTREAVKASLDVKESARANAQIDRLIKSSSRTIEGLTHRFFYPWTGTKYFDWPNDQYAKTGRLWFNQHELVSATSITTSGTVISASDYFLEPVNSGPPYTHLDLDLASNAAFDSGDTAQRSIAITGVFYQLDEVTAGALAEALDSSETAVDVTDSAVIGVGDIIRVDTERMIVRGKSMLDTTVNIDAGDSLTASNADVSITLSASSGAPEVDEIILIDSERMLVVDKAGLVLTVKRAWDGSILATHAGSSDIYALRTLNVIRGVLGTTAASHDTASAVNKHQPPGLVEQLAIAETLTALQQEGSAYARVVGSGDNQREASGKGLSDLREQVYTRYGRKVRMRAI